MRLLARRRHAAAALARLRAESGLTIIEAMIAMVVLLVGVLGTFLLIDTASAGDSKVRAREGATNLAREILEEARSTPYADIGKSADWFDGKLTALPGRQGAVSAPSAATRQVSVSRRGYSYTAVVSWCSVDDSRDGYGAHAAGVSYCADSATVGTVDVQPEDFKRVSVKLSYKVNGVQQPQMVQTSSFGSSGVAIGPETSSLVITSPSGLSPPYVIASNPVGGIVTFLGTSPGANDMRFAVDGVEQTTGVVNNLNGSWSFNWNIGSLKDGTYTISATAIDVLGSRGQPRSIQVKLSRGAPVAPQDVTGGYNQSLYDGSPSAKKTVVELEWDANPEGTVTGYSVERGGTVVSGCGQSQRTSCIEMSPAASGSTTYTIKTHYTDAAGSPATVSTGYTVTAPGPVCGIKSVVASADTHVSNQNKTTNYGTATAMWVRGGAEQDRTLVRFPLPSIDSGCTFASAALKLFGSSGATDGSTRTHQVFRLAGSWAESTVTWNSQPATTGTAAEIAVPDGTNGWRSWDVTAHVGAMYSGSDNNGFLVRDKSETGSGIQRWYTNFNTREATNKPVLDVTFSGGGTPLATPGTPTGLAATANADGTTTLSWNAPTSGEPVEFYRVYRDGQNHTQRYDTVGAIASTLSWTDTSTGGTAHDYRVTAVSRALAESEQTGAVRK